MVQGSKKIPMVDLPLGATEDRVCGTIDIEKALTEGEWVGRRRCVCVCVCVCVGCSEPCAGRRLVCWAGCIRT